MDNHTFVIITADSIQYDIFFSNNFNDVRLDIENIIILVQQHLKQILNVIVCFSQVTVN